MAEESVAQRETREWLVDVRTCFGTDAGRKVFNTLWTRYALQPLAPHVGANNPLSLAHISGQKELMIRLRDDLESNIEDRVKSLEPIMPIQEELQNV